MRQVYLETASLDQRCYDVFGLTPEILMENAAFALAKAVRKRTPKNGQVLFVCGTGNNGADGIAAARMLHKELNVEIYLPFGAKSKLAQVQLQRAQNLGVSVVSDISDADVYVDALFGAGLNRPLDEASVELILALNKKDGYKIACDIPSGIRSDFVAERAIFRADESVVMGSLKLCLLSDGVKDSVGKLKVANLGLSRQNYEIKSEYFLLQKKDMKLPFRAKKDVNKGSFGHACIMVGSKAGASKLAGAGAFYFGAGLVSLVGDEPKNMPSFLMNTKTLPKNATAIAAGMGLEMPYDINALKHALLDNNIPLVIDASLFHQELIKDILASKKPIVLTPHPKEFCSILSTESKEISVEMLQQNRFKYAKEFSLAYPNVVLLLKGANTIIAQNGELFINTFGTQALAKGGSGDVLSGMITALIAQGYDIKDAAISASLAHSLVSSKLKQNNFAFTPKDIYKGLKWL